MAIHRTPSGRGSEQGPRFEALPPLSLYVHLPWCVRKCPYCDFNSHEAGGELPEAEYVQALLRDLEGALPLIWGRPVHTIFIGGGTPSLFSAQAIDELLAGIRARIRLDADAEITMEANPGTVEADRFRGYAAAGVNRVSLGIQSFDDAALKALGRIHGADEAVRAAELAARHVGNFNIDLMYALPAQTVNLALADIAQAVALGPTHLSAYQLTLEPNTLFHRYPPDLPDEDLQVDIEEAVHEALGQAGYARYETSAFARPGRQCRHNLNYWRFGDYLGIGAGAHGKISLPDRVLRQIRFKQPKAYLAAVAQGQSVQEERTVPLADMPFEFMLNALRLTEGFELSSYAERTGDSLAAILQTLDEAQARGLVERDLNWVRPTALGRRFLNDLQAMFLKPA
ncbi:MAG TPA: radical SAM family heme chaperone HemW [Burkholderiaceae bacterium]|nr:radical SAM family heme chaperone HemW [Burkholderiaceae bacterium]